LRYSEREMGRSASRGGRAAPGGLDIGAGACGLDQREGPRRVPEGLRRRLLRGLPPQRGRQDFETRDAGEVLGWHGHEDLTKSLFARALLLRRGLPRDGATNLTALQSR